MRTEAAVATDRTDDALDEVEEPPRPTQRRLTSPTSNSMRHCAVKPIILRRKLVSADFFSGPRSHIDSPGIVVDPR